jgi:hypothetical protein
VSCATLIFLLTTSGLRADLTINGQQTAAGPSIAIGSLSASVTGAGAESGLFTLNAGYRNLMSDANGLQVRFFQVIYYDDEPVTWNGSIITAAGTAAHTGDVVDVPSGGWDYESTTGNKGGDDTSPFYESDTANNPGNGNPYRFPGLSYPALHSADGVNPGTMATSDSPGLSGANHQTLFETFLTYEDPTLLAAKQVDLLGGYSWGVQTDGSISKSGINPSFIGYASITAAVLTEMQSSLNISGYSGWSVIANDVIIPVPEPGSLSLCLLGVFGMAMWRRARSNG